jgi:hypothetical protein
VSEHPIPPEFDHAVIVIDFPLPLRENADLHQVLKAIADAITPFVETDRPAHLNVAIGTDFGPLMALINTYLDENDTPVTD